MNHAKRAITFLTDPRFLGTVAVLLVVGAAAAGVSATKAATTATKKATAANKRTAEISQAFHHQQVIQNRQSMIVANGQCLRLNDGRRRFRKALADDITILFRAVLPDSQTPSPAQITALNELAAKVALRNGQILQAVNCAKAAPLPPNVTVAEAAQLPKSTPIPPLKE